MLTAIQAPVSLERLTGSDAFEVLRQDWQELQDRGGAATFFQTWEWNSLWWRHLGRGTPYLLTFRRGADLVGIAPCFLSPAPLRALRFIGSGMSDYLGLIALPEDQGDVSSAFCRHLVEERPAAFADLHQVRPCDALGASFPDDTLDQAATVGLTLPRSWDEYSITLTAKMRSNVKRAYRDLEAVADYRLRTVWPEEAAEAIELFFRLHGKRWRSRGLPGSFLHPRIKKFHKDWATQAAHRNWLRISIVEMGGQPIGTLYGIRYRDTYYYYQAGFDPKASKFSPGTILVAYAIRNAIEEGCTTFDFLRGEETYKSRWKPQEIGTNRRIILPLRGAPGRWASDWHRRAQGVETKVRERFEGGSLLKRPQ